jgi:hypothetical protein
VSSILFLGGVTLAKVGFKLPQFQLPTANQKVQFGGTPKPTATQGASSPKGTDALANFKAQLAAGDVRPNPNRPAPAFTSKGALDVTG